MTQDRNIETFTTDWQGITLSVTYEPRGRLPVAHLQVKALRPDRARLPITETGYRSHFLDQAELDAHGSPLAYVQAWLVAAADSPEWREYLEESRQGSLF